VPYPDQLAAKQQHLQELFAPHWDAPIPVLPSPTEWHYRNKVDFNFARKQYPEPPPADFVRETVLGFNKKGKWYFPLDMEECRIAPDGADALLKSVREWVHRSGVQAVDNKTHDGVLKILLMRRGVRTGETMVMIITADGECDEPGFVEAVKSALPVQSIYRGIHRGRARGAFADELHLLDGAPEITEELHVPADGGARKLKFRISPLSFFQTNTLAAELLYGEIRTWVQQTAPDILYDLYGGAGGIAFTCSDIVKMVRSVEVVESASRDGEYNAGVNGVDNVFFTTQKMRNYLQQVVDGGGMERNSAVVVDPPREGMTPKPLKRLIGSAPPYIMYVSCKPTVFAQELPEFLKQYRLTDMRAVDLFPHTPHVELMAALQLR
jgi:23S rRNA (uracil1939-C5)-methyltransferase